MGWGQGRGDGYSLEGWGKGMGGAGWPGVGEDG